VVGEGGQKTVYLGDTEPFDPKSIPMQTWREWEASMMAKFAMAGPPVAAQDPADAGTGAGMLMADDMRSVYSHHTGVSMPMSVVYSVHGGMHAMPMPMYSGTHMVVDQQSMLYVGDGQSMMSATHYEPGTQLPSDDMLLAEIRTILATADLMTITKKMIRQKLSLVFGVNLLPKKAVIGRLVDEVLSQAQG
jgi:chitin synthase